MEKKNKDYHHDSSYERGFRKFKAVEQPRRTTDSKREKLQTSESQIKSRHIKISEEIFELQTTTDINFSEKGYEGLSKKLEQKKNMQVGTRHFNKSFYSKLSKKIADKPLTFYKFGLKEEDKRACQPVFKELFKIQPDRLKGSLSITELWDNKTSVKFLKENQMFFNKNILMQQFENIDKERKQHKRQLEIEKERQFVRKFRENLEYNRKLNEKNQNYMEVRDMNANEACNYIRTEIDKLVDKREWEKKDGWKQRKTSSRKIIAGLEKDYDQFDRIASKFENNMIILL